MSIASSGEKAIATINNNCFDLVVTDLLMPGLDGFQVLKATKRKDSQTMVIILTGYADVESAVDALRFGADDFLQKPCDPDELLDRISNCFAKQELLKNGTLQQKPLPVCCYCKKIRDDRSSHAGAGGWYHLEEYFYKARGLHVTHGCCPDCFAEQLHKIPLKKIQSDKQKKPATAT